jgi:Protein of unknown function (DUF732)
MRLSAILAVPLTGLALTLCPVSQADPEWTTEDWNYTKYLSSYSVNYQGRVTTNEMIAKAHMVCDALGRDPTTPALVAARDAIVKQGVLTQEEATKVSYSAISVYCPEFNDVLPIP